MCGIKGLHNHLVLPHAIAADAAIAVLLLLTTLKTLPAPMDVVVCAGQAAAVASNREVSVPVDPGGGACASRGLWAVGQRLAGATPVGS